MSSIPYPHSPLFNRLLDQVHTMPVIDCHEHLIGPEGRPKYKEPITMLLHFYMSNDLASAAFGVPEIEVRKLLDEEVPTDQKWPLFERLWRATEHTAYARVTKIVLKDVYGETEVTRDALERMAVKMAGMDEAAYFRTIDESNIHAMVVDVLGWAPGGLESYLSGKKTFPPKWRLVIPLPLFHPVKFSWASIQYVGGLVDRHITSLDEFLEAAFTVFQRCIERGAIGFKDQSAYERSLSYDLVPEAEADQQFNQLLSDPRRELGWPEGKPLNDYLFHQYMRFARDLKKPVQIHTGHMAGIYNEIEKTRAVHLTPLFELHQQVRFDLFHGNWPYMGDLLFLGKNYPNVSLDLCWLHIIDPAYAIEMLERATLSLPHTKINAFGGDYGDQPEFTAAHLQIARQNVAAALTNLVEGSWLEEEQAVSLAKDWLFNNPNRFFSLGFEEV